MITETNDIKKIGIMTFHDGVSHGAMLQAYGLQTTLAKQGHKPEIINYDRKVLPNKSGVTLLTFRGRVKAKLIKIAQFFVKIFVRKHVLETKRKFNDFQTNELNISKVRYQSIAELRKNPPIYDNYIVGSDQVWNPDSINHEAYYFTFLSVDKNTIAYAPSIGVSKIDIVEIREKMREYLTHVKHLSCREEDGKKVIEEITNRKVERVLDPSLLLSHEEWLTHFPAVKQDKRYVLCYLLGSLSYGRKAARKYARKHKLKVIYIFQNPREVLTVGKKKYGVDPKEFISLFEGAEAIFTDSFHGTAFAVNFNKAFYSLVRRNHTGPSSRISRIKGFLEIFDLQDRLLFPKQKMSFSDKINFDEVNKKLEIERNNSLDYLKKSLAG